METELDYKSLTAALPLPNEGEQLVKLANDEDGN